MPKRSLLFVLCLAVVLTACAKTEYVRPYEPTTRADSLTIHADSVAWAADERTGDIILGAEIVGGCILVLAFITVSIAPMLL